jgi:hypothetical protein
MKEQMPLQEQKDIVFSMEIDELNLKPGARIEVS